MALFSLFGKSESKEEGPREGSIQAEKWKGAHLQWKARLEAVVAGTSTEELDPKAVCRDDRCDLGKWISGEGKKHYGGLGEFLDLRSKHATFHLHAGMVVDMCHCGDLDDARKKLAGDFEKSSAAVAEAIDPLAAKASGR